MFTEKKCSHERASGLSIYLYWSNTRLQPQANAFDGKSTEIALSNLCGYIEFIVQRIVSNLFKLCAWKWGIYTGKLINLCKSNTHTRVYLSLLTQLFVHRIAHSTEPVGTDESSSDTCTFKREIERVAKLVHTPAVHTILCVFRNRNNSSGIDSHER